MEVLFCTSRNTRTLQIVFIFQQELDSLTLTELLRSLILSFCVCTLLV